MSNGYYIAATVKTPEITVDADAGVMTMRGRSLPEDSIEFYEPAIEALERASQGKSNFELIFYIEYLNTSSSSVIRSIIELFFDKHANGELNLIVKWHFEEDDLEMEEMGHHFEQTIPGLPIEYIEVDSI